MDRWWLDTVVLTVVSIGTIVAGLVDHLQRIKAGHIQRGWKVLLTGLVTAWFVGMFIYWLSGLLGVPEPGNVLCGITAAFLGSDGLIWFKNNVGTSFKDFIVGAIKMKYGLDLSQVGKKDDDEDQNNTR